MNDIVKEALTRFTTGVLAKRTTFADQVDLVNKLAASDKFAEEAKPVCFVALVDALVSHKNLNLAEMFEILEALWDYQVFARLDEALPDDVVRKTKSRLVARGLTLVPPNEAQLLCKLMDVLIRTQVAHSRGEVLSLALGGQLAFDVVDNIAPSTEQMWYA